MHTLFKKNPENLVNEKKNVICQLPICSIQYERVFWIEAVYTNSRRAGWGNASSMTQRLRVTLCLSFHSWAGWGQMEGGVLGIRLAWGLRWEVWPRIHVGFEWEYVTSGIFTIAEKCMCVSVHINDFHLVIMHWINLSEKRTAGNSIQTKIASFYIRCRYSSSNPHAFYVSHFAKWAFYAGIVELKDGCSDHRRRGFITGQLM